jgi:demethylsterigmatocystin 6-O-methyltransferase
LAKTKYQDIDDIKKSPFQVAFNTDDSVFEYWGKRPEKLGPFNEYMVHRGKGRATWLSVFPEKVVRETNCGPEEVLFVDIGGGIGGRCAEFRAKYSDVKGRVILQDLPHAIQMALPTDGVENTVHDFFTPQTVRGNFPLSCQDRSVLIYCQDAKFYYLRQVLHDWPDVKCQDILRNIIPEMGKDSVILIDDIVLPGSNVHWEATQLDMVMMACLAGRERTGSEWEELLRSVGLVIDGIWTYTESLYESVLVVKRK